MVMVVMCKPRQDLKHKKIPDTSWHIKKTWNICKKHHLWRTPILNKDSKYSISCMKLAIASCLGSYHKLIFRDIQHVLPYAAMLRWSRTVIALAKVVSKNLGCHWLRHPRFPQWPRLASKKHQGEHEASNLRTNVNAHQDERTES